MTTVPSSVSPRSLDAGWGEADFDAARARVAAVAALAEPRLLVPSRVTQRPDGGVMVEEPYAPGVSLAAVLAHRGSLRGGECVWLGMAVAEALAALHRAGLAHGAVTADAVWIGDDGVLLRSLVGGAPHGDGGRGAVAREDVAAPDDVAALGALLAGSVRADDADRVGAWTAPMTGADPAARPTAAMVARALASCAPPEPLRPEPLGIAAALRRAAAPDRGGDVADPGAPGGWAGRGTHAEGWRGRGRGAGGWDAVWDGGVERLPEARWWRLRHNATRLVTLAAVRGAVRSAVEARSGRGIAVAGIGALVAGVVVVAGGALLVPWQAGGGAGPDAKAGQQGGAQYGESQQGGAPHAAAQRAVANVDAVGADRPVAAAVQLVNARVQALGDGDGAALLELTAEGSPARAEAADAAAALDGGVSLTGMGASITALTVRSAPHGSPRDGDVAVVVVTVAYDGYDVDQAGVVTHVAPATVTTVLTLTFDGDAGWLVSEAAPAAG